LALAGAVLGFLADKLPPFGWSIYCVLVYALTALSGAAMASVLQSLFEAIRERVFQIPPKETEIQTWAEGLRDYYFDQGLRGDRLQSTVVRELRQWMIGEFAGATVHNRGHNAKRKEARTQGIVRIVAALTLAFSAVGITFVHDWILVPLRLVSPSNAAAPATNAAAKQQAVAPHGAASGGRGTPAIRQAVGTSVQMTQSPEAKPVQPAQPAQ
jgi:hypothetical protein